ncbi:uracil-DNA glycosylase family protein [Candidatus Gracilibacteria bacterium]|nr:uracil-DNA glycosylase family protein [Candidatus Gracilibacteria bacterium]
MPTSPIATEHEHYCHDSTNFPLEKFLQRGSGNGRRILILGEAPAPNGWRKSGKAFYRIDGKLLPTGKNLNLLLAEYQVSVETCAFTELVKCFVGNDRKQLSSCGEKCWLVFLKQLQLLNTNLIISLGVKTLEIFNNQSGYHLEMGVISEVKLDGKQYRFLPIYHPSTINPFNHQKNQAIFEHLSVLA